MARTASDYPVTFDYGETSPPYSHNHPHRGSDRACPTGTPVLCGGVTIGLTGSTGKSTGAHLHVQEWRGSYAATRKPQNSFKGGTVVDTGTSPDFGNYVTIRTADGWNNTYAHLSAINVPKGQVIGEDMGRIQDLEATEQRLAKEVVARDARIAQLESRVKQLEASEQNLAKEVVARDKRIVSLEGSKPTTLNKDAIVRYIQDNLN